MEAISVRDKIDTLERKLNRDGAEPADFILMDTYTYALLREEIGVSPEEPLDRYRGYKIKIDPDIDDIIRLI